MKASPGTAYNYIIKGRHPYLGTTEGWDKSDVVEYLEDYRPFRGSSSWLEGTSYLSRVLILWKRDGIGLVYLDVPKWKVSALHFFAKPSPLSPTSEMTDDELHQLLLDSLQLSELTQKQEVTHDPDVQENLAV